jgi:hypothetical protein
VIWAPPRLFPGGGGAGRKFGLFLFLFAFFKILRRDHVWLTPPSGAHEK